jgi:hypothetical protein
MTSLTSVRVGTQPRAHYSVYEYYDRNAILGFISQKSCVEPPTDGMRDSGGMGETPS